MWRHYSSSAPNPKAVRSITFVAYVKPYTMNTVPALSDLLEYIQQSLDAGQSRDQILADLTEAYGDAYRVVLARKISAVAATATQQAHRALQRGLVAGLTASLLGMIALLAYYYPEVRDPNAYVLTASIAVFFEVTLWVSVWRYRGDRLYTIMLFMAFKGFMLLRAATLEPVIGLWAYGLVALVTLVLAFLLRQRAFPAMRYGGPRQRPDGTYDW